MMAVVEKMKLHEGMGSPNLDGYPTEDLMDFWYVTSRGWAMARYLFTNRPTSYITATAMLGNYAANKATAMQCRAKGDITAAQIYEHICEQIY